MSTSSQLIAGETTLSLDTLHDFIRPGERDLYVQLHNTLTTNLAPEGILECILVDEIRRAMWRLRRCGIVEENLAAADSPDDPMQHDSQAKIQLAVDRARSQAHRLLHKCTTELRKLQTERLYRNEGLSEGDDLSTFGIANWQSVDNTLHRHNVDNDIRRRRREMADLNAALDAPLPSRRDPSSFCENPGSFCKNTEPPPGLANAA